MLSITRKPGEAVIIMLPDGSEIRVEVKELRRNQVRIAFGAPAEVKIWREEIKP